MLIFKSTAGVVDWSDAVEVEAAITAGEAVVVGALKAEIPEPSPIEGENTTACGSATILDGFEWLVSVMDFNVNQANNIFYQKLNTSRYGGVVLYFCEQDEIQIIDENVSFVARPLSPLSNTEKQRYQVDIKWTSSVNDPFPVIAPAPVGIFLT